MGSAHNFNSEISTIEYAIKMNRISFPFQFMDLNLSENNGISLVNKNPNSTTSVIKIWSLMSKIDQVNFQSLAPNPSYKSSAKEQKKSAFAGVGRPMKFSLWRVSRLNFANRNKLINGIKKAMKGNARYQPEKCLRYN